MNKLYKTLFIFLAVCFITGCSQPVGSITTSGGGGTNYDYMEIKPKRYFYDVNAGPGDHMFSRDTDFRAFVVDSNGRRQLNPNDSDLLIEIVFNPGMSSEFITPVNSYFFFTETGRYIIRGTYDNKSDEYTIEVRGDYVNPGDGNNFVDIVWL